MPFHAYAASSPGGAFQPFDFDPGPLGPNEVEIDVAYCGLCHSDLSMLRNEFGVTAYPFVPGHEAAGTVAAVGGAVSTHQVGQKVGLGWFSRSCMHCKPCMSGDHNLCTTVQSTIIGRHGAFANKVRCSAEWARPLPDSLDMATAGPLFCGGITVFNPIVQMGVLPTSRVGVIGIGGLGHMALQFLNKWGCEVIAFTSSASKQEEALRLGAHRTVNSRSEQELAGIAESLDFILSTVAADVDWGSYLGALAPRGRLHFVGVPPSPVTFPVTSILFKQRAISSTPLGSPQTTSTMLEFCARHGIAPVVEEFAMSDVNEAFAHLEAGKARYRIVLKN
ncbi:MAG: alcohol dehydrogenase catalytic domain-containing protein [Acidobacteria bacterium]|nr:alcohol dehydrogenase catalytic domain-containing protein [Acidobacteriota bacterium]